MCPYMSQLVEQGNKRFYTVIPSSDENYIIKQPFLFKFIIMMYFFFMSESTKVENGTIIEQNINIIWYVVRII